jgi:putative transposase
MSEYRRSKTKGGTYFFTVITYRKQKFLCDDMVRTALRNGIRKTQSNYPLTIDAWVLMPDHLHCIWTLPPDDANYGIRWSMIKQYVTKTCGTVLNCEDLMTQSKKKRKESTIWQRRFWEHQIRDDKDYKSHMDYIHYNPVKHKLTACVNDWPYSTFHRFVKQGIYTKTWGGSNLMNINDRLGE